MWHWADKQTHKSRWKSFDFIVEIVPFNQADSRVGFYELFLLCGFPFNAMCPRIRLHIGCKKLSRRFSPESWRIFSQYTIPSAKHRATAGKSWSVRNMVKFSDNKSRLSKKKTRIYWKRVPVVNLPAAIIQQIYWILKSPKTCVSPSIVIYIVVSFPWCLLISSNFQMKCEASDPPMFIFSPRFLKLFCFSWIFLLIYLRQAAVGSGGTVYDFQTFLLHAMRFWIFSSFYLLA